MSSRYFNTSQYRTIKTKVYFMLRRHSLEKEKMNRLSKVEQLLATVLRCWHLNDVQTIAVGIRMRNIFSHLESIFLTPSTQ